MRRRKFVQLAAGTAIAWPDALRAQQHTMAVVGYLSPASVDVAGSRLAALRQGLGETGYVEGQNVAIEYRWAEGRYDRLPALAADLVSRKVEVLVTGGGPAALAAKNATATIPIVFIGADDPVKNGLVAGLARPDGNLTGFSILTAELLPKLVELLSELVPQARVMALLVNPNNTNMSRNIGDVQEATRAKGVRLQVLKAATEAEIESAFASLAPLQAGALIVAGDPFFFTRGEQLVALASHHSIPAIYGFREFATVSGLISYGASLTASYRQSGVYAGKILQGTKPTELPIQQPTTFELVINLKTAKALGLTVPQSLLARADEVIE